MQGQRRNRFRDGAGLVFALATSFACGGGGDERPAPLSDNPARAVPGCEQFDYRVCDIRDQACEDDIYALMACLHGEDSGSARPPPVHLLSESDAEVLLASVSDASTDSPDTQAAGVDTGSADPSASDTRADTDADFSATVRGLELIGLIDPGLIVSQADVLDSNVEQAAAFYLPETREVVVIDRGEPAATLEADSTLAHEFVHALQDARHDLSAFDPGDETTDQALALSSVVEGEAMLYQLLFTLAYQGVSLAGADYDGIFESLIQSGNELAFTEGSPMLQASFIFPYTYGTRYAGARWLAAGRQRPDSLFDQPPQNSLAVLWSGPDGKLPAAYDLEAPAAPPAGYRLVSDDAAGAWIVFSHALQFQGDLQAADALFEWAQSWRADHYWVYEAEDTGQVAVVWRLAWADETASQQLVTLLEGTQPGGAFEQLDRDGASARLVVVERAADLPAWVAAAVQTGP